MLKNVKLSVLIIAVMFVFAACGGAAAAPRTVRYVVGTAASTGTHYAIGVAIAEAVNANSDYLRLTPQATEGGDQNVYFVGAGELDFGFVNAEAARNYKYGLAGQDLIPNILAVSTLQANNHHLIASISSGIETMADAGGKRVGMSAGSTSETLVKAMLLYHGVEWETDLARGDISGVSDLVEKLNDGDLDMIYIGGAAPLGQVIELMSSGKFRLISIPPDDLVEIFKIGYGGETLDSYMPSLIPAGVYPNQDYEVWGSSVFNTFLANESLPEEDIYELCRIMVEHWDTIRAAHASISRKEPGELPMVSLPLHPGAERLYREMGLID